VRRRGGGGFGRLGSNRFFALCRCDFRVFLLGPRRVVPAQIGEQLGLTLLEALDAELKPVAVALAEAVVVELAYEGGKVGVLERPRQLRRLQQVGLPDGERAALRGPGDDVVAAGIADEVPRFPAWGGRAASEDGVGRRRDGGGDLGGTGEISPGVGAPRNFLTCPTARASSHRPGRAYRSRFGASRGGTSRCVTSRGHTREMSRGQRTRPAPRARPAAAPLRDPRVRIRKKLGTSGGGGGTARRTIGTVTRSRWRTGSWRPSRCPAARSRP
jgi:hypothetical protein